MALALAIADGAAVAAEGRGEGDAMIAALTAAVGTGLGFGVCEGAAVGEGVGSGDAVGASVGAGVTGEGCGTGVTTGAEAGKFGVVLRFMRAEPSAPIPSPAMITPIATAANGSGPPPPVPPPLLRFGVGSAEERRRRESGSGIGSRFPRIRQEALPLRANAAVMMRVRVPIDVNAVLCADSTAFALATPLRVGELLSHAVLDALGPRAPQDKRERTIARTHAGLNEGAFILEIDGRIYEHCDGTLPSLRALPTCAFTAANAAITAA